VARTSNPQYVTVHNWLAKDRGPATEYRCRSHHHYGETWAYTGLGGDNERTGISRSRNRYAYEYAYSVDLDDYIPMCRQAHNHLDAIHRNAAQSITGDEDESGLWLL
jgi:hypothetical protein